MEAPRYRHLKIDLNVLLPDVEGTSGERDDLPEELRDDPNIVGIYLSLLHTEPFQTKDTNVINVCSKKANQRFCTDQPRLIQKLVQALLGYESRGIGLAEF